MAADCLIVTDGARGNEKQCLALAYYLAQCGAVTASPARRFRLALRQPWAGVSPRLLWGAKWAVTDAANTGPDHGTAAELMQSPAPRLLISCGRRAALVSRLLKRRAGHRITTVQILNPRISTSHFDWVVCPAHDQLSGANVISTEGALHDVDDVTLASARQQWPELAAMGSPRVAVLIGASNAAYTIDQDYLHGLLVGAAELAAEGTLMVTTSRRTPDPLRAFTRRWLDRHLPQRHLLHVDSPGLANPYPGMLAFADRIVVSSDSVNMISEALGTGSPVHCPKVTTGNQRFSRFQARLMDSGRLLSLGDRSRPDYPPLRETLQVARTVANSMADSMTKPGDQSGARPQSADNPNDPSQDPTPHQGSSTP